MIWALSGRVTDDRRYASPLSFLFLSYVWYSRSMLKLSGAFVACSISFVTIRWRQVCCTCVRLLAPSCHCVKISAWTKPSLTVSCGFWSSTVSFVIISGIHHWSCISQITVPWFVILMHILHFWHFSDLRNNMSLKCGCVILTVTVSWSCDCDKVTDLYQWPSDFLCKLVCPQWSLRSNINLCTLEPRGIWTRQLEGVRTLRT